MDPTILRNTRVEASPLLSEDFSGLKELPSFDVENASDFRKGILAYAASCETACVIDSNYATPHREEFVLAAIGSVEEVKLDSEEAAFDSLQDVLQAGSWYFGYLTYDLKNDLEDITSSNPDKLGFPSLHFFSPAVLIYLKDNKVYIKSDDGPSLFERISSMIPLESHDENVHADLRPHPRREDYLKILEKLKGEIARGSVYEINFCRELSGIQNIHPLSTYLSMSESSPAPFSAFYRIGQKYLLCASPERFIMKSGMDLISQPMKGTRRRSADAREDQELRRELQEDRKERAENVMIADLVRNDLSHTARRGSVKVEELCGVYTFEHVHQMISTVSSVLRDEVRVSDVLRHCFPMGSMTGAPKLSAMGLIEENETFKRGLFSGSVGYITPNGNFDFNVVIRSILYDEATKILSIPTGSAVTALCDPEMEWEECELKSKALLSCLR